MNLKNFKITALQPHTTKNLGREKTSFLRALSVVSPVFVYYMISTAVRLLFVAWFSNFSAIHEESDIVIFLVEHSRQTSAVVNVLAMVIAMAFVMPHFKNEGIVYKMPQGRISEIFPISLIGLFMAISLNFFLGSLQESLEILEYQEVEATQFSLPLWMGIFMYGILSPLAEEVVFRGLVYNRMRRQFGVVMAIWGSSVLFGLYHGNLIQAIYGLLLGLLMAILYERYSSFLVPLCIHSVANIGIYCFMNIEVIREFLMKPVVAVILAFVAMGLLILLLSKRNSDQ